MNLKNLLLVNKLLKMNQKFNIDQNIKEEEEEIKMLLLMQKNLNWMKIKSMNLNILINRMTVLI